MAINLMPQDLQAENQRKSQKVVTTAVSVSLLIILATIVTIIFSYRVYVTRQLSDATLDLNQVNKQLEKYRIVEGTIQSVNIKIDRVRDLLEKRYSYGVILDDLRAWADGKVTISGLELADQKQFGVIGNTEALSSLAAYIQTINENTNNFQDLRISTIRFNEADYSYEFTLGFDYENTDTAEDLEASGDSGIQ